MPDPIPETHTVTRSPRNLQFRLNATQLKLLGIGVAALLEMQPQIIAEYPKVHSLGLWITFIGLYWDMAMKRQDVTNTKPTCVSDVTEGNV